jgi:hypothetical protein
VASDVRAPIFYDSNDTAYFFDGASTSRLNQARFQNRISVGDGSGTPFLNAGSPGIWLSFNGGSDIFMGSESSTSAGFYVGGDWRLRVNSSGSATASGDMRAPIFYDSNNTAYYFDGAGSTALNINGGITFAAANPTISASSYFVAPGGAYFNSLTVYTEANLQARGGVGNDTGTALTLTGGTGGFTQINGSARSPIFYDSDNTAYYFDGASTAANAMTVAGGIHVSVGNVTGQGIILADDGDIVDLNDGYCAMRFSLGVRIHSGNRTGGAVVALTNGGAVIASGDITAFGSPSDIKLKYNIENIPNALEKLLTLNGVNFNYKKDGARSTGVIAQEVEKVLPEVIYEATNPEGTEHFKAVRYGNMVGLLIEAIKEQQTHINNLQEQINSLKRG